MEKNIKKIVSAYLRKALKELASATVLFEKNFYDQAISCCYYCVFNAAKAALESIAVSTSSHKQTGIEFNKHFVKANKANEPLGEILKDLVKDRSFADYDVLWDSEKE